MRALKPAAFLFCIYSVITRLAPASADPALPAALAQTVSFRGRVAYEAHRADDPAATVIGTLVVSAGGWDLEERSAGWVLHASSQESWLSTGSQTAVFDDPFQVDALANSWAAVLGTSSGSQLTHDPGGASWTTSTGVRIYLDPAQDQVIGVSDGRASGVSFAFAQWTTVNGLRAPRSILRMRAGVTDASIFIDSYQVQWVLNGEAAAKGVVRGTTQSPPQPVQASTGVVPVPAPSPWRPFAALFALFAMALGCVAWLRRDAFVAGLSRRLADDPRAWRHEGVNLFVSAEGVLWFEGRPYRVGAEFFARTALVQSSPLFIRVSAPQVPRAVIMARKFPLPRLAAISAKRSAAGFTLIESLAATALFATVVVAAVFPALIVLAHADLLAEQHETATQIAANALADEEAALAYRATDTTISDGSVSSSVAGMTLRVTVSPSGVSQLLAVTIDVSDARGRTLARAVTMVGPPVPAPAAPSASPAAPATSR